MSNRPMNVEKNSPKSDLKQYAGWIIGAIVLALAAYFGWAYWQNNRSLPVDAAAADKYAAIETLVSSEPLDADTLAAQVEELTRNHADTVYAWQALMQQAKVAVNQGDYQRAIDSLNQAKDLSGSDAGLQAITSLRLATVLLADDQTDAALASVSGQMPQSFEASQQTILGDIYAAQDNKKEAVRSYDNAWQLLQNRQEERGVLRLKMQELGVMPEPIKTPPAVVSLPSNGIPDEANSNALVDDPA